MPQAPSWRAGVHLDVDFDQIADLTETRPPEKRRIFWKELSIARLWAVDIRARQNNHLLHAELSGVFEQLREAGHVP